MNWLTKSPIETPAATAIMRRAREKPLEYCSAELWYVCVTPPPCAMPDWDESEKQVYNSERRLGLLVPERVRLSPWK